MTRITNHSNLPAAIVRAVENDPYDAGEGISCTKLIGPAMIARLTKEHDDEIEEDAADRIWALLGQAVHSVIERSAVVGETTERRLYSDLDGQTVSGQYDLFNSDEGMLTDFKVTSVWAVKGGLKPEWTAQLNVLAWLLRRNGAEPKALQLVAILRDWKKNEHLRYGHPYPSKQAITVPAPLWPDAEATDYIRERLIQHNAPEPPPCTPAERWDKPTTWACMKEGRKSAVRVLDSEKGALAYMADAFETGKITPGKGAIVERPGGHVRCEQYCAVNRWCPFWLAKGEEAGA